MRHAGSRKMWISTRSTNCSLAFLSVSSANINNWPIGKKEEGMEEKEGKEGKKRKGGINDLMSGGWWWQRQKRVDDDFYVQWWVTIRLASQIINIYKENEYIGRQGKKVDMYRGGQKGERCALNGNNKGRRRHKNEREKVEQLTK